MFCSPLADLLGVSSHPGFRYRKLGSF